MEPYQGLFYLTFGFSVYILMLLTLRLVSSSREYENSKADDQLTWHTKEELEIVSIIEESHDVKTFRFKRLGGKRFMPFSAGQFLSFQIGDDDKLLRSYSISGSCENHSTLQVSIKKIKDGIGSGWFHSLNIGDHVWAFPPGGLFTDENLELGHPRIYIGGGIGITPLISMIKTNLDRANTTSMTLFYGMNSLKDLVFHDELLQLAKTYINFNYYPVLSKKEEEWNGDTGYISFDYIKSKIKLVGKEDIYFCGPPIMTDTISEALVENGHKENLIHSEKFASPVSFDPSKIHVRKAQITVGANSYQYEGKDSLLDFLEAQDVIIPFACRVGVCGTCKCKVIEGEVDQITDSGLTGLEKKHGHILSCVARPVSDLKLEV